MAALVANRRNRSRPRRPSANLCLPGPVQVVVRWPSLSIATGTDMKTLCLAALFALASTAALAADSLTVALPDLHARRVAGALKIDGELSEAAWVGEPVPARFIQSDPVQAARSEERRVGRESGRR